MRSERLRHIIDRFSGLRIAVIGDFFLDKYLDVDSTRSEVSIETGKTVHQVMNIRCSPGAAGNVVNNIAALGAGTVHAIGCIGDEGEGFDLTQCLNTLGCNTDGLFEVPGRRTPTYLKPRDKSIPGLEGEHSRYDTKNHTITPPHIEKRITDILDTLLDDLDAVMIVEQDVEENCGVITTSVREHLIRQAKNHPDVLFFADSRSHPLMFRNIIVKPNQFELMGIENPQDGVSIAKDELFRKLKQLREETGAPVFVTLGASGIVSSDPEPMEIRAVKVTGPVDTTGAGDSAASGIVLAHASGATVREAALIGNLTASVTVQKLATCGTCTPDELVGRLALWMEQDNHGT